jgi:hypothetical protein
MQKKSTLFAIIAIILSGCTSLEDKINAKPAIEQRELLAEFDRESLIQAVGDIERSNPLRFLAIPSAGVRPIQEVVQRATLFQGAVKKIVGHKIQGSIVNSALVADYKDFKISLIYVAQNGSEISEEEFVVYTKVSAGTSAMFDVEITKPDQAKSYKYRVVGASATE